MAVARESGLHVGQAVSLDGGLDTLQALADTLPSAQRSASDGHAAHAELIWPEGGQHLLSLGKEETYTIDSLNANLRTYLAAPGAAQSLFQLLAGGPAASGATHCLLLPPPTTPLSRPSYLERALVSPYLATPWMGSISTRLRKSSWSWSLSVRGFLCVRSGVSSATPCWQSRASRSWGR